LDKVRIAFDAMGGDNAPLATIKGAAEAARTMTDIEIHIFGRDSDILPLLNAEPQLKAISHFHHTETVIDMGERPSTALKKGGSSSMRKAIDFVAEGKADVVLSAGNTGALMAISKFVLRMLPDIERPAIASLLPTMKSECVLLDLGANVECDASNLFQFALLGQGFAKAVLNLERPRIALLNVGTEEVKGSEQEREAAQMIKNCGIDMNFIGFVEGHDIAGGSADVIVTDGFSGNIALKTAEGVAKLFESLLREAYTSSLRAKIGYLISRRAMSTVKQRFAARGGRSALLLGLNGLVVKSHGGADPRGILSGFKTAREVAKYGLNKKISDEILAASAAFDNIKSAAAIK